MGKGPKLGHSTVPERIPSTLFGRNEFEPDVYPEKIYCGLSFNGALNNKGEFYTWGKNRLSCLGLGNEHDDQFFPFRVSCLAKINKASLGVDHCVVMADPTH